MELLQRYRRDRRELLNFLLAASVIKKVVMPPGAVSYDDIDLDQISVDFILECARKSAYHFFPMSPVPYLPTEMLTSPESKDDRHIFWKTRSSKCKVYVLQLMSKPWHHHICVLYLIVHCNLMFRPVASSC